eukprot:403333929
MVKSADIIFQMNKYVVMGFTAFGVYKLVKNFLINPFKEVTKFLYIESRPLSSLLYTYGKNLIIITGPTTGLGPAYCKKLIQAGYRDFLLIDEDKQELDNLKLELQTYYDNLNSTKKSTSQTAKQVEQKLNLELFVFDFDNSYEAERFKPLEEKMHQVCKEKEISMLINNFAKVHKGSYESMDYKDISEMINGNINAITFMSRFVLQKMKDQPTKCAIINVGSATAAMVKSNGKFNQKQYQVYQATQTYQVAFTNLLHSEYKNYIDFMNDMPATFDITKKNLQTLDLRVSPESHVEQVLKCLGRQLVTNGTLRHQWMIYMLKRFYIPFYKLS